MGCNTVSEWEAEMHDSFGITTNWFTDLFHMTFDPANSNLMCVALTGIREPSSILRPLKY